MKRSQALTVAIVTLLVAVPVAAGATSDHKVTGRPGIDVSVPDNELRPGDQTSLTLVVLNDGNVTNGSASNPQLESQVTTARAVKVRIDADDGPLSVSTNEQVLSRLPDGASATVQFGLTVDRDAQPGEYTLPVNVTYNYTESVDPRTGETNTTQVQKTINKTVVVKETAQFEVVDVDSNARVGSTGTINVTLRNTGYEAASDATVALTSQNTDLTFGQSATGSRFVSGEWAPGENRTVSYRVRAAQSATRQRYAFSAQVTYENPEGNARQSRSLSLGVTPAPEQTFSVVGADSTVAVAEEGTVTLRIRNDGPIDVSDASVTLQSTSNDVVFGQSASASEYVGAWEAGETRRVQVNATAVPDAETRNYSVQATVAYDDGESDPGQSRTLQFALRPDPEQSAEFEASDVSSTLRVGEEGTLTGTVTNTGDAVATNVVIVFETQSQTVTPGEREYPVGTLASGESATFEFDVEVASSADAGPRQFTLRPTYRNEDDQQRQGESFDVRAEVRPDRDLFDASVANRTVERGQASLLKVTVTNDGNETLSDVSATIFADDPVSVEDGDAFADTLEPGASTTLTFQVSASGGALTKQYPVEMDFQYDEPDGDTKLSSGYTVGVEVTEPETDDGGGPPLVLVAVAGVVVLLAAGAYLRYGR